jgi:hypothetical protein
MIADEATKDEAERNDEYRRTIVGCGLGREI